MRFRMIILLVSIIALSIAGVEAQPVLTAGAQTPFKLTRTPGGNFLLAESGTGVNDGRVSLLSVWGDRFNLLGGLPSGTTPQGSHLGPTSVADAHRTLYIVIGEGNVTGQGSGGQQVPNPNGLSSPIFSSVIRARFTPVPDAIRSGFQLSATDTSALADGNEITLQNSSGEQVQLLVLTDFRDIAPDPRLRVRQSNPFATTIVGSLTVADLIEFDFNNLTCGGDPEGDPFPCAHTAARLNPDTPMGRRLEERSRIYVADAGMNTVTEILASTGRSRVITRFPPLVNTLFPAVGGPVTDPVPTSIFARADGTLLVASMGGFPFAAGSSKVYRVDPASGTFTPWIEELTSATEVIEVGGVTYVLEISGNLRTRTPGRLLRFESPSASPTVVTSGLIGPTGLAFDASRNELLVTETFTGLVKRIALAR